MTEKKEVPQQSKETIWEFIPVTDYKLPSPPIAYRVKGGIAGLWQKLKPAPKKTSSPLTEEDRLETLPEQIKRSLVPDPDWTVAAAAFSETLKNIGNGNSGQHLAYVTPPHSPPRDLILKYFAEHQNWRLIPPPTTEQILAGDMSWLKPLTTGLSHWILPNLEKCYLRHHRGLALVRNFFALLQCDQTSRGIIGCDSWAWAYLEKVMPEMLPFPLTLQAFDHQRLTRWFRELTPCLQDEQIRFRQMNSGIDILAPLSNSKPDDESALSTSQFIKFLAAHSRGIPGIAWLIWGSVLRSMPDDKEEPAPAQESHRKPQRTIWVPPWEQLDLPQLTSKVGAGQILVLHNLLLHNGLSDACLRQVLPLTVSECNQAVTSLAKADLIKRDLNEWRVSAMAYPAVRQLLKDKDYLTDNF
ncbi:MAG: hypothetical protein ACU83N_06180 [Gammaproteobacteria bacterium]